MRSFSTPQSAINGEITKLAIVECFVSIAAYIAIGFYRHSFSHYAWAIAIAPLMLFRTERSSMWGLEMMDRAMRLEERGVLDVFPLWAFWFLVLVPLLGVGLRIAATTYWLVRRPWEAVSEMPENWVRQSLCTDLLHPPEILPLEEAKGGLSHPTFSAWVDFLREDRTLLPRVISGLLATPFFVLGFLPSLLYRFSFKATSLVYAPFVWVAHTSLHSKLAIKTRLERFTKGEMEKTRRRFSEFVFAIAVLKIGLHAGWFKIDRILAKIPSPKLIEDLVQPTRFPWWQATLVIDATLTWALFLFADAALARLDEKAWPEKLVLSTLSGGTLLRNVLSIVTMGRFCYLAILEVAATSKWASIFPAH